VVTELEPSRSFTWMATAPHDSLKIPSSVAVEAAEQTREVQARAIVKR
jgi:hypothetical protein